MPRARAWLWLHAARIMLRGGALHMLDTFWLKVALHDPRLPMHPLHALSVLCMGDIATV